MAQKPDDVTAKDAGGGFAAHPEGQFAMSCVDVVNLGINVEVFPGQEPREVEKVALVFASGERQEDGSLTLVTTEMTNSANEKANLRRFIEAWRGRSYSADQVAAGLPISKLAGQPALVSIEHVVTRKGKKFAKIKSISPVPQGVTPPPADVVEEYTRPKFLTDRKAAYATALTKHRASLGAGEPEPEYPGDDDDDDPLPF